MKEISAKEWMVRWALIDESRHVALEMLLQVPDEALKKQYRKSYCEWDGMPAVEVLKTILHDSTHKFGVSFDGKNKRYPYAIFFPERKSHKGRAGPYGHLDNALKRLRQEAEKLGYV